MKICDVFKKFMILKKISRKLEENFKEMRNFLLCETNVGKLLGKLGVIFSKFCGKNLWKLHTNVSLTSSPKKRVVVGGGDFKVHL